MTLPPLHIIYQLFFGGDDIKTHKSIKQRMISLCLIFASLAITVRLFSVCAVALDGVESRESYTKAAVQRMREGFYAFESAIDLSNFNILPEEIGNVFAAATKNDPYLFFVDNQMSYTYESGGYVRTVKPKYNMSREEAGWRIDYCKREVGYVAQEVDRSASELARALYVHDYLCRNFRYDLALEGDNIYDFFRTGAGTCQGYTWAYMAILREVGIDTQYVASDSINHIWNLVRIDGEWYHSDVTWDDPPSGEADGAVSRRHFLCSDKKVSEQGHKDWYSEEGIVCLSSSYDGESFFAVLHTGVEGDVDHSYTITLEDIMRLRLFWADKLPRGEPCCLMCADSNGDLALTVTDIETLRRKVLDCSVDKK